MLCYLESPSQMQKALNDVSPNEHDEGRLTIIYRVEAQEGGEEPDVRKRQLVSA